MVYARKAHRRLRRNKWINGRIRRHPRLLTPRDAFWRFINRMIAAEIAYTEKMNALVLGSVVKREIKGRFIVFPVKYGRTRADSE